MQALEGVKILDLTRLAPGPYCVMLLADLGADVIRVEEFGPKEGRRAAQPSSSDIYSEMHGFASPNSPYNALNRNKRSIALNLKTEEGRKIFYKLIETTDVVVEEFRPGTTKRLGVDYETLRQINSRIIYCAITGFGQDGPYRDLAGHDINYVALAGALSLIGYRGGPVVVPHNFLGDFAGGGMHGAIAILAALMARQKTGRGQFVDVSLFDGVVSLMSMILSYYFATGVSPGPGEHVDNGGFPFYNVYETNDNKYISLGPIEPWFWANLCRAVGREDLVSTQWDTGVKRDETFNVLKGLFKTKTRDEWHKILSETDTCASKVQTLDELPIDPHIQHRKLVVEIDHPHEGKVRQVGSPFKLSDTPPQIRRYTPASGEHTEEVLLEAGFSKAEIQNFRGKGACN
jgi:crotonobetainyl-CoA:carnitine CoA-transferase CaiB-like acyl-CoA transferase